MIILGEPDDVERFYCADGEEAFEIHRAGFCPKYRAGGYVYFEKTKKLLKFLKKRDGEL